VVEDKSKKCRKLLRDEKKFVYLQANRDGGALVASRTASSQIDESVWLMY
jgi:hypothetical protein